MAKRKYPIIEEKPTVWMMFECPGGNRWTSTSEDSSGEVCNFSRCNCGGKVELKATTKYSIEAHNWFRDVTNEANLRTRESLQRLTEWAENWEKKFGNKGK